MVNVILPIPDDLARRLGSGDDLARRALEAFAVEEYRAGRLTRPELRHLLGFATRPEFDAFLKARDRDVAASDLVARFRAFRADKTLGGLDPAELIREGRR